MTIRSRSFGALKLTIKNADPNKRSYAEHSIGFDARSFFQYLMKMNLVRM